MIPGPGTLRPVPPTLSGEQLRRFGEDGYVVIPDVVPQPLLDAADHELDALVATEPPTVTVEHPLATRSWFLPPERLPAADAALRKSGGLALAAQLVAPLHLDHGLDHIQVVLNLPVHPHRPGGPHIDGHRAALDRPGSFTMLAGVYLVDELERQGGNLWVWPGSHLVHQRLFQERGVKALLPVDGQTSLLSPPVALGSPTPVTARRGDLLLAHFLLGHNSGGNTTDHIRRILYFRLSCDGHEGRWEQTFLDPFTEFAPVHRALDVSSPVPALGPEGVHPPK